ncbi:hypothetical protein BS17DRAFT_543865 [Gyrodon lividus]|nr:hypothetical protein BS17DRAFT_543865 [Gyrodon lividus]
MPICSVCTNRSFANDEALRQHETSKKHKNAVKGIVKLPKKKLPKDEFQCSLCSSKFKSSDSRMQHQADKHPVKQWWCCLCLPAQSFETLQSLDAHKCSQHTSLSTTPGQGVSQPTRPILVSTEQIPILPSPSPETVKFEACSSHALLGMQPRSSDTYDAHLDDAQDGSHGILAYNDNRDGKRGTTEDLQVTHYCFSCSKVFITGDDLWSHVCPSRHILQPHCSVCHTPFDDELSLRQHLDDSRLSLSCHLCHTPCCSNGMLEEHINGHPTCRRCGDSFIDDQDLCKHMVLKHPTVVCWDCDAAIVEQDSLELHYTDSPNHPTCAFCGVGMKNVNAMDEHVHTHHAGERLAVPGDQFAVSDNVIARSDEFPQTLSTEHVCDKPSSSRQDEDGRFTSPSLVSSEHGSEGLSQLAAHQSMAQLSALTESFGDTSAQSSSLSSGQSVAYVATTVMPSSPSSTSQELIQGRSKNATPSAVTAEPSTRTVTHRLHCRICQRDPCEDMTATICGHIFCKNLQERDAALLPLQV